MDLDLYNRKEQDNMKYVEELSLNAWPSHKIELYDGWLIRFSHNYTYRTNSVEQVGASTIPAEEKDRLLRIRLPQPGNPLQF